jgi:nucleotide-binding universal stress UspA family protein
MSIVVAFDNSAASKAAVEAGVNEAKLRRANLAIVEVFGESPMESSAGARQWHERAEKLRAEGASLSERLRRENDIDVHYVLATSTSSDIAGILLSKAEDLGADLLVVGIRHRSPVGKLILGSTSQSILLQSDYPVLAVKESNT